MQEANEKQMKEMQEHHEAVMKERLAEQARLHEEGFKKEANELKQLIQRAEQQREADARRNEAILGEMRAQRDSDKEMYMQQIADMETSRQNMLTEQRKALQEDHAKVVKKLQSDINILQAKRAEYENVGFWGHLGQAASRLLPWNW